MTETQIRDMIFHMFRKVNDKTAVPRVDVAFEMIDFAVDFAKQQGLLKEEESN